MKPETNRLLQEFFARFPTLAAGPVSQQEIAAAEEQLARKFDSGYRDFIAQYGGAMVGSLPLFGLRASEVMGVEDTVLEVTKRYRKQGWSSTAEWMVISYDGTGNPIGISTDGHIWLSDHESERVLLAETFDEFVLKLLNGTVFG